MRAGAYCLLPQSSILSPTRAIPLAIVNRRTVDLIGRVCVVTGATRGLGLATAKALAGMGATVVMLGRDRERGEVAAQRVRAAAAPGADVSFVRLDLASVASVCAAAADIASRHDEVHVLVNNAGVHLRSRAVSPDGFEMTWAVNHLGPFLFTNQMLPQLRAAADARIVTLTSEFARFGRVTPAAIGTPRASSGLRAYFDTKLANMLFTIELARRLEGTRVVATCVHPGVVATELMREWPRWIRRTWEWALRTPESGAGPVVGLAVSKSHDSGAYYVRWQRGKYPRRARNAQLARDLWVESERLVGL
jgi:NAD(P)-dependent dehydrogenase (short-subunit alcohol dehydrogenase family)